VSDHFYSDMSVRFLAQAIPPAPVPNSLLYRQDYTAIPMECWADDRRGNYNYEDDDARAQELSCINALKSSRYTLQLLRVQGLTREQINGLKRRARAKAACKTVLDKCRNIEPTLLRIKRAKKPEPEPEPEMAKVFVPGRPLTQRDYAQMAREKYSRATSSRKIEFIG